MVNTNDFRRYSYTYDAAYAVDAFKIVQVGDRAFALYRQHGTNNLFSVFIQ